MKAVFILFVLACAMAVVYGDLVCGTNFCKTNPCVTSISSKSCRHPSVYRANHAGMCSCCPACVTLLDENAACKKYDKEIGQTPSAICRDPLKCLNGVCMKVPARS